MSAFVVSRAHVAALVQAWLDQAERWGATYYYDGLGRDSDPDRIGEMLTRECVKSVSYRYPNDQENELPGCYPDGSCDWAEPYSHTYRQVLAPLGRLQPVDILKMLDCYEYQSCEHPGWDLSEARTFCNALRGRMICRLPGYDAAPWEYDGEKVTA